MQKTPSKVENFTKIALLTQSAQHDISKITRFIRVFMLPWIWNFDIGSIQSRPFLPSAKQGNSFQVISWHLQSSCSRYFFPKTIWQSNIGNAEDNMTVHFSLLLLAQHGARGASGFLLFSASVRALKNIKFRYSVRISQFFDIQPSNHTFMK